MLVRILDFDRRLISSLNHVTGVLIATFLLSAKTDAADYDETFFRERVQPILVERCHECHSHSAKKLKANLMLDSREGALQGGDSGPSLIPGDADSSLIIMGIRYDDVDFQMPPKSKLSDHEIAILEAWVKSGATWPDDGGVESKAGGKGFDLQARRASHWAWQPLAATDPPEVSDSGWPSSAIDRFILQKLEAEDLRPAPAADRRTLIRRLSFVLRGLPPTMKEVREFARDESDEAYGNLVDRLLASPQFGERWARHWLDVMRYSETLGHEFDYVMPNAWRYRDYLIRAINQDVPYDEFLREHVAGDLVKTPRVDVESGLDESAAATASFWFGQQVHSPVDVKAYQLEVIDNQIDTLSRGFQSMTVSCARCHDHKFDAISTKDFYALYGVLESSRYLQRDLVSEHARERELAELESLRAAVQDSFLSRSPKERSERPLKDGASDATGGDRWFFEGVALSNPDINAGELVFTTQDKPVHVATRPFRSSRRLSVHAQGLMHSETFVITNRYLHLFAAGQGARAKVIIENFQVIRAPIYGGIKKLIDDPEFHWTTLDLEMWQGQRAYLELVDQTVPDLGDALRGGGYPEDAWFDLADVVPSDDENPPHLESPVQAVSMNERENALLDRIAAFLLREPEYAPGLTDSEGVDEHVFIRGGPRKPGELVPRRYLEALSGNENPIHQGSGRGVIADGITSGDNPLTARVWVNRIWHHLFGSGLVPTVDDFGELGEEPSHPELLDWLADWFMNEGEWSTKNLIRLLVRTSTWQQSAIASDETYDEFDPQNRLLHKWTVRRLEGEAIRDSILATSGRLNETMYGPPVPIHLTGFMTGRGRPGKSGPVDGDGRRSIYVESRRNFMSPMMLAFDTPQAAQTFGARTRSNVPAQALILLNDPFIHGEAEHLAKRVTDDDPDPSEAVRRLYRNCFQRDPTKAERETALHYLQSSDTSQQAWSDLCHVLFNTKEFVFVN